MREIRKILVPVDFSTHAERALETAIELAKLFGAEVHLLHCYQTNPIGIAPYEVTSPVDFERDVREAELDALTEIVLGTYTSIILGWVHFEAYPVRERSEAVALLLSRILTHPSTTERRRSPGPDEAESP